MSAIRNAAGEANLYYRISVLDNGIGFEQQMAEKIFDIFERLHSRDNYEGNGIGLALCKRIVQKHGGSIAAYGFPGMGARFDLLFPAALT